MVGWLFYICDKFYAIWFWLKIVKYILDSKIVLFENGYKLACSDLLIELVLSN